jgi:glycosyltransferase involved in cell wall biosynthesis
MGAKSKLLFLVAEDWYFCSHRLPLAVAAHKAGYEVSVVTRVHRDADTILSAGIKLIPLRRMRRSGSRPLQELASILELLAIYRCERPDLVHHVGLKPVLYGSLVARIVKVHGVINALAGLGFVFSSNQVSARLIRPFVKFMFYCLLRRKNTRLIVQNDRDSHILRHEIKIDPSSVSLIRGAGVDVSRFSKSPPTITPPLVVLVARMLWDKGIGDFVEAVSRLREAGIRARFALVGAPDPENPTSIPESQLRAWHDGGRVEWWGYCSDVPAVLAMASIVCLPTFYGEGVPKALIEAMASSRPIVTTNIPGCRELVEKGKCGILISPRDISALSTALKSLIQDPGRCQEMGKRGRLSVQQSLSLDGVIHQTLCLYAKLAPSRFID